MHMVFSTFSLGTGVAFAPEPCWVALAPEWSAMKWVQGRMWPSFRGECDPCFCVAGAIVSEPQKDFSTLESHIHVLCDVPTAISINFQDTWMLWCTIATL